MTDDEIASAVESAHAINEQLSAAIKATEGGIPLSLALLGTDEKTKHVRTLAIRLLKNGMAGPDLQLRFAEALERASLEVVRRTLSIKARKGKDWKKRAATCEAFFWAMEIHGIECEALLVAYDVHYGAGAFDADKRDITASRNGWKYDKTYPSKAAKNLAEALLPLLRHAGFALRTAVVFKDLGLPCAPR